MGDQSLKVLRLVAHQSAVSPIRSAILQACDDDLEAMGVLPLKDEEQTSAVECVQPVSCTSPVPSQADAKGVLPVR